MNEEVQSSIDLSFVQENSEMGKKSTEGEENAEKVGSRMMAKFAEAPRWLMQVKMRISIFLFHSAHNDGRKREKEKRDTELHCRNRKGQDEDERTKIGGFSDVGRKMH